MSTARRNYVSHVCRLQPQGISLVYTERTSKSTVSAEARSDDLEYCEPAAACLNLRVQVLEAAMEFKPKPRTSAKLWEVDSEAISAKGSERGARHVPRGMISCPERARGLLLLS